MIVRVTGLGNSALRVVRHHRNYTSPVSIFSKLIAIHAKVLHEASTDEYRLTELIYTILDFRFLIFKASP